MKVGEPSQEVYSTMNVAVNVMNCAREDGWYEVNIVGSHYQFKHPIKKGRTTIKHPDKDIPRKTLDSIERQSGLRFR